MRLITHQKNKKLHTKLHTELRSRRELHGRANGKKPPERGRGGRWWGMGSLPQADVCFAGRRGGDGVRIRRNLGEGRWCVLRTRSGRFRLRATYFLLVQKVGKDTFRGEVPKSFFFVFAEKSAMISVRPADAPLGLLSV